MKGVLPGEVLVLRGPDGEDLHVEVPHGLDPERRVMHVHVHSA